MTTTTSTPPLFTSSTTITPTPIISPIYDFASHVDMNRMRHVFFIVEGENQSGTLYVSDGHGAGPAIVSPVPAAQVSGTVDVVTIPRTPARPT